MPPRFTRPTINAAVRTMDGWYRSSVESFLLEHELEEMSTEGSVVTQANRLLRHLLQHPDARTSGGESIVDTVVRDLVERAIVDARRYPRAQFAERFPQQLARALAVDGFVVQDGEVRSAMPAVLGLPAADDEVHVLLRRFGLTVPEGHLDQAIKNHGDSQWASANGQLRTFMEALLDEIALRIAPDPGTLPGSGHARRTWLAFTANPPFLLVPLNEWEGEGRGYFEGFFKRLHPEGSHPGLSDEDDCTFRLHSTLINARLLLRRLAVRLGP